MSLQTIIKKRIRKFLLFLLSFSVIIFAATIAGRHYRPVPTEKIIEPAKHRVEFIKSFPFLAKDSLKEWEEKVFKNKVVYSIESDNDASYVRAQSDKAASALYYKTKLDTKTKSPVITWKWRVEKFPVKALPEILEKSTEDDFAARVYIIFPSGFFTNWKVLEYIWAHELPVGTKGDSPYSKNIKLMVIRSGPLDDKQWLAEARDIVADYIKAFGRPPECDVGAIAFMTNAEHTGTTAEAVYDDIKIGYKQQPPEQKKEIGR